jgi:hypothetical protein
MEMLRILKKILKNDICTKVYEVFDLIGAYLNVVNEK